MKIGYAHGDHLMAKMTLLLKLWMVKTSTTSEAEDSTSKDEAKGCSCRQMDESVQRPRRAVAKAVAHPLRIQPGIHGTEDSSSNRPVARARCSYKSYALCLVLWRCPTVG
jgi:hypothetical protein